jgi:hypothetical protein
MPDSVTVSPQTLRGYGKTAAAISGELATAGAFDLGSNMASMTATLGPIAMDFLAAFGVAQANHAKSYADLATLFGRRAAAADANADNYENADHKHAGAFDAIGRRLS